MEKQMEVVVGGATVIVDDASLCCLHCVEVFTHKKQLRQHNREYHANLYQIDRRKFARHLCNLCSKHFADSYTLKHHKKTVHLAIREHVCSQCNKAFLSNKDLKRHIDGVHMKKRIVYPSHQKGKRPRPGGGGGSGLHCLDETTGQLVKRPRNNTLEDWISEKIESKALNEPSSSNGFVDDVEKASAASFEPTINVDVTPLINNRKVETCVVPDGEATLPLPALPPLSPFLDGRVAAQSEEVVDAPPPTADGERQPPEFASKLPAPLKSAEIVLAPETLLAPSLDTDRLVIAADKAETAGINGDSSNWIPSVVKSKEIRRTDSVTLLKNRRFKVDEKKRSNLEDIVNSIKVPNKRKDPCQKANSTVYTKSQHDNKEKESATDEERIGSNDLSEKLQESLTASKDMINSQSQAAADSSETPVFQLENLENLQLVVPEAGEPQIVIPETGIRLKISGRTAKEDEEDEGSVLTIVPGHHTAQDDELDSCDNPLLYLSSFKTLNQSSLSNNLPRTKAQSIDNDAIFNLPLVNKGVRDKADLIGLNKEEDNLIAEEEVQPEHILYDGKVFSCSFCDRRFIGENYLEKHCQEFHSETSTFVLNLEDGLISHNYDESPSNLTDKLEKQEEEEGDSKVAGKLDSCCEQYSCTASTKSGKLGQIIDPEMGNSLLFDSPAATASFDGTVALPKEDCAKKAVTGEEVLNDLESLDRECLLQVGGQIEIQPTNVSYICDICDQTFTSKAQVTKHKKVEHNIKLKFKCNQCDKCYSSEQSLKQHQSSIHEGTSNICNLCLKPVIDITRHIRLQHTKKDERNFICKVCSKPFRTLFAMTRHNQMVHLKLKPWQCDLCEKSFGSKRDVERHRRLLHLRQCGTRRSWTCPLCNVDFKKRYLYNQHKIEVHSCCSESDLLSFLSYELSCKRQGRGSYALA